MNKLIGFLELQAKINTEKKHASGVKGYEFTAVLNQVLGVHSISADIKSSNKITTNTPKIDAPLPTNGSIPKTKSKVAPNPNAAFTATGGAVVVRIQPSYSDFNNKIYWSTDNFKTRHYIGKDNQMGTRTIGVFPAGTQIEFAIDNGVGGFFRTGAAALNPDGLVHALITKSNGSSTIRFEDMAGGGDWSFNDAIISVTNQPIKTIKKPQASVNSSQPISLANNVSTVIADNQAQINSKKNGLFNWFSFFIMINKRDDWFFSPEGSVNRHDDKKTLLMYWLILNACSTTRFVENDPNIKESEHIAITQVNAATSMSSIEVKWLSAFYSKKSNT